MIDEIQKSLSIYQEQLNDGSIRLAYLTLVKYVAEIKSKFPAQYHTGNVSPGYLDYTYFPFFDPYLRAHKLRFGVVLNHEKMQFELWLMGQNVEIQKHYWGIMRTSPWNHRTEMPKYSVLEVVLENQIDFHDRETMTKKIIDSAVSFASEVQHYLENVDC